MNNGAFGENFPYSNFHDLNMDWIIKIAKDFLDQYTHIQEVIENGEQSLQDLTTSGLQQLQEKADNLEELLQAWYNEHSEDIANQLADAIADLNEWYTTHQNYLNQYLTDSINAFNHAADLKAQQTIESIPDDYTTLSDNVKNLATATNELGPYIENGSIPFFPTWEQGNIDGTTGVNSQDGSTVRVRTLEYISTQYNKIKVNRTSKQYITYIYYYDSSYTFIERIDTGSPDFQVNRTHPYYRLVILDNTGGSYSNPINVFDTSEDYSIYRPYNPDFLYNIEKNEKDINKALYNIIDDKILYFPTWEQGNIDATTGADSQNGSTSRVRTRGYISTKYNKIKVNRTSKLYITYIYYYDSSYTFIERTDVWNSDMQVSGTHPYYRLVSLDYTGSSYSNPISYKETAYDYTIYTEKQVNIPAYFQSQMESTSNAIKNHNEIVGKNGITFMFCTDIHWDNNEKHSPSLINAITYNTTTKLSILGGDYISQFSSKETAIATMRNCISAFIDASNELYPIFGNHDRNSNGTPSTAYMTNAETYSIINSWMSQRAKYSDKYFDFYIDDNKSKTRFVCLNTGAEDIDGGVINSASLEWTDSIISELSSDWHIVIVAHWLFSPAIWNRPLVNGVLTGSYTQSALSLFTLLDSINNDISKPTVEAIITGHVHCDYNDETTGGIPIIYTDSDSMGAYGEYTATAGTTSEQCFDVITIDYSNKKIYCDRVGRGISREISY